MAPDRGIWLPSTREWFSRSILARMPSHRAQWSGIDVTNLEDIRARLLTAKVPVPRDIDSGPGMRCMIVIDHEKRQIFIRERVR